MTELFKTICADPPWSFGDKLPGPSRGAEKNYSVLSIAEIENFLVTENLVNQIAPDARLFLWRVASQQEEALRVMRAWGFIPKAEIVWLKKTATGKRWFGMGRQVRMEHEVCLIGIKGRPEVLSKSIRSTFEAPYTRHSGKPDAFFDIVEQLSPGPYLELFSRVPRVGWTQLGDEFPKILNEEQIKAFLSSPVDLVSELEKAQHKHFCDALDKTTQIPAEDWYIRFD
jgi:N6-adenosine-specific RNA methylase IME4